MHPLPKRRVNEPFALLPGQRGIANQGQIRGFRGKALVQRLRFLQYPLLNPLAAR